MSDDNHPAPKGRSLRQNPQPRDASAADPDPGDDGRVYDDDAFVPQLAAKPAPEAKVLVWNHTGGIRMAVARRAMTDSEGKPVLDGAGHTMWAETISIPLQPGLNIVDVSKWEACRPNLERRINLGELQSLGSDMSRIRPARLVQAIRATGSAEPLRWLLERETRHEVVEAAEEVYQEINTMPGRVAARGFATQAAIR